MGLRDAVATEQVGFGHEVPRVPWRGAWPRGRHGGRLSTPLKLRCRGGRSGGRRKVWQLQDPTGKSEICKFKRRLPQGEEEEG